MVGLLQRNILEEQGRKEQLLEVGAADPLKTNELSGKK